MHVKSQTISHLNSEKWMVSPHQSIGKNHLYPNEQVWRGRGYHYFGICHAQPGVLNDVFPLDHNQLRKITNIADKEITTNGAKITRYGLL